MPTRSERWSSVTSTLTATSWWVRSLPSWHVAFGVFTAIAAVVLAVGGGPHPVVAAVALAAVVLAYVLAGAPGAQRRDWRCRSYLAVMVLGFGVAFAAAPGLDFLLFIAFPQTWLLTGSRREGTSWTVATALAGLVGLSTGYGEAARTSDIAVSMLVSVAFTCALGFWISRVIAQSAERAELIETLESTRAELAAVNREAGVSAERARLAADIHDTLAQAFTGIVLLARTAADGAAPESTRRQLGLIEDSARAGLAEARTLVAALSPVDLEEASLGQALQRLAARVSRESGVAVDVVVEDEPRGLPRSQEVVLLRAAQEALGNVRKHAGAHRAQVLLDSRDGAATLEVWDDGVGIGRIDVEETNGFGLSGMRRRVEEAGGVLQVGGAPGGGTRLRVAVPSRVGA